MRRMASQFWKKRENIEETQTFYVYTEIVEG